MDGGGSAVNDRPARTVCSSIGVMVGGHIIAWADRNGEAASVTKGDPAASLRFSRSRRRAPA
jgi:hypothetical protein